MTFFVKNINWTLFIALNMLKFVGFLVPENYKGFKRALILAYSFLWAMFVMGLYIIVQAGKLIQVWGDLSLMVSTTFLLFTNVAYGTKILNLMLRKNAVKSLVDQAERELRVETRKEGIDIIKSCDRETTALFYVYLCLSAVTVLGWTFSGGDGRLPLSAWYPYDTSKSPAYEITYFHQAGGVITGATFNVCLDTVATSLIALCRCRLKLLALSLRTLGKDLALDRMIKYTSKQEDTMKARLRKCVLQHQTILDSAAEIQRCFSIPIFGQFAVSSVIICITAYQLAVEIKQNHVVLVVSMVAYLLCMIIQVFLYCYQGHQLADQSLEIAYAAYDCPWYACSASFKRSLLLVMLRSRKVSQLTVGGLTTLSLTCFAAMIKASYTFFTVLQQMDDRN